MGVWRSLADLFQRTRCLVVAIAVTTKVAALPDASYGQSGRKGSRSRIWRTGLRGSGGGTGRRY